MISCKGVFILRSRKNEYLYCLFAELSLVRMKVSLIQVIYFIIEQFYLEYLSYVLSKVKTLLCYLIHKVLRRTN